MTYIKRVHELVKKIPRGKVTTYGALARVLNGNWKLANGNSRISAQMVGWALHQNKDPKVSCHRVVNREGRVASAFGFGGPREQRHRLEAEGVTFKDEMHCDLEKCLWQGMGAA